MITLDIVDTPNTKYNLVWNGLALDASGPEPYDDGMYCSDGIYTFLDIWAEYIDSCDDPRFFTLYTQRPDGLWYRLSLSEYDDDVELTLFKMLDEWKPYEPWKAFEVMAL